jgi:hypothetical protein
VVVAFQSLLTNTSHSNFQSNEPFLKFLWQLLLHKVAWSKEIIHCTNIVLYLGSTIALPMISHVFNPSAKYLIFNSKSTDAVIFNIGHGYDFHHRQCYGLPK